MNEITAITENKQYIKVEIGDENFGIDISIIDNIVRMQRITRVPSVPAYIKGVINLRGEIVPIMNLRLKMGLEEIEETKSTRFIIIKLEKYGKIGLIVDAVKEVVSLTEDMIEKIKHDSNDDSAQFVFAVGKTDSGLVSLLDLDAVTYDKSMKED